MIAMDQWFWRGVVTTRSNLYIGYTLPFFLFYLVRGYHFKTLNRIFTHTCAERERERERERVCTMRATERKHIKLLVVEAEYSS